MMKTSAIFLRGWIQEKQGLYLWLKFKILELECNENVDCLFIFKPKPIMIKEYL